MRRFERTLFLGLAGLGLAGTLLASAPLPALAQMPTAADLTKRQQELFEKGNKLYDEGNMVEAEAAFAEAWKIKRTYDVAGNLGDVELANGKPVKAAEHLAFALREFPAGGRKGMRKVLEDRFAEAKKLVGTLTIQVNVPAEVFLNGASIGKTPFPNDVYVAPGQHILEARAEGYPPSQQGFMINKGEKQAVSLTLKAKGKMMPLIYAGAGLGVASLAMGIGLIAGGAAKAGEAEDLKLKLSPNGNTGVCAGAGAPADCKTLTDLNKTSDTLHNVSFVGFGLAAAFAGATLAYAFWPTKKAATGSPFLVVPVVTADTKGFALSGQF